MTDEAQPQRPEFSPREREAIAMTVIGSILARKAAGQQFQVGEIANEVQTAKAIWRKLGELLPDVDREQERRRLDTLRACEHEYDKLVDDVFALARQLATAANAAPDVMARFDGITKAHQELRAQLYRLR